MFEAARASFDVCKVGELERGLKLESFRIQNVPARVKRLGDLWEPLLAKRGRFKLEVYL